MISIKNVTLPNKPLSNFDLEDATRKLNIPFFRGIFLLLYLESRIRKNVVSLISIQAMDPAHTGSLGIRTGEPKSISIATVCSHR